MKSHTFLLTILEHPLIEWYDTFQNVFNFALEKQHVLFKNTSQHLIDLMKIENQQGNFVVTSFFFYAMVEDSLPVIHQVYSLGNNKVIVRIQFPIYLI